MKTNRRFHLSEKAKTTIPDEEQAFLKMIFEEWTRLIIDYSGRMEDEITGRTQWTHVGFLAIAAAKVGFPCMIEPQRGLPGEGDKRGRSDLEILERKRKWWYVEAERIHWDKSKNLPKKRIGESLNKALLSLQGLSSLSEHDRALTLSILLFEPLSIKEAEVFRTICKLGNRNWSFYAWQSFKISESIKHGDFLYVIVGKYWDPETFNRTKGRVLRNGR